MPDNQQNARKTTDNRQLIFSLGNDLVRKSNNVPSHKSIVDQGTYAIMIVLRKSCAINILHEHYTPKSTKRQVKLDINTFFVDYDHFYVNIIMSTI